MTFPKSLLCGVLALLAAGCTGVRDEPAPSWSRADQEFVQEAARANLADIETADLARQNGGAVAVRDYGRQAMRDSLEANEELRLIARRNGVSVPERLDDEHEAAAAKLGRLGGPEFDRAYIAERLADNQERLARLEKAAREADEAMVRAWAARTAQRVRASLERGQEVAAAVTGGSSVGAGTPSPAR